MPNTLIINAAWDASAQVWVASSDKVPGLATEASSIEELSAKLNRMIPELLEANGAHNDEPLHFQIIKNMT